MTYSKWVAQSALHHCCAENAPAFLHQFDRKEIVFCHYIQDRNFSISFIFIWQSRKHHFWSLYGCFHFVYLAQCRNVWIVSVLSANPFFMSGISSWSSNRSPNQIQLTHSFCKMNTMLLLLWWPLKNTTVIDWWCGTKSFWTPNNLLTTRFFSMINYP